MTTNHPHFTLHFTLQRNAIGGRSSVQIDHLLPRAEETVVAAALLSWQEEVCVMELLRLHTPGAAATAALSAQQAAASSSQHLAAPVVSEGDGDGLAGGLHRDLHRRWGGTAAQCSIHCRGKPG